MSINLISCYMFSQLNLFQISCISALCCPRANFFEASNLKWAHLVDKSVKFHRLNICNVLYVVLWIKYWLMWFESLLVFILFKCKKRPNISIIRVVEENYINISHHSLSSIICLSQMISKWLKHIMWCNPLTIERWTTKCSSKDLRCFGGLERSFLLWGTVKK